MRYNGIHVSKDNISKDNFSIHNSLKNCYLIDTNIIIENIKK